MASGAGRAGLCCPAASCIPQRGASPALPKGNLVFPGVWGHLHPLEWSWLRIGLPQPGRVHLGSPAPLGAIGEREFRDTSEGKFGISPTAKFPPGPFLHPISATNPPMPCPASHPDSTGPPQPMEAWGLQGHLGHWILPGTPGTQDFLGCLGHRIFWDYWDTAFYLGHLDSDGITGTLDFLGLQVFSPGMLQPTCWQGAEGHEGIRQGYPSLLPNVAGGRSPPPGLQEGTKSIRKGKSRSQLCPSLCQQRGITPKPPDIHDNGPGPAASAPTGTCSW